MTFDREQTIERTAQATVALIPRVFECDKDLVAVDVAEAALPVIVRAVTDEIRALHQPIEMLHMPSNRVVTACLACGTDEGERLHPCPTVRLCDQIDAQAGVQR